MNTSAPALPTAESRLADLALQNPALHAVLTRHGMDACCGGALTLAQAAAAHKLPLEALLEELRAAGRVQS